MLDSDEDEIDENGAQYLEKLEKSIHNKSNGGLTIEVHTNLNLVFLVLNIQIVIKVHFIFRIPQYI